MPRVLIIADDLTGANDSAVQFAERGFGAATMLVRENGTLSADLPDVDIVAVSTESRNASVDWAIERVSSISSTLIARYSPDVILKKIDSTLRGNPGAEVAAIARVLGTQVRVVTAPAYPENGRTVIGGRLFVNGSLLEETYAARDPLAAVRSSLVAGYFKEVSALPGVTVDIADAAYVLDMDSIVASRTGTGFPILWVGSAGLAAALARHLLKTGPRATTTSKEFSRRPEGRVNRILGLFGSLNPATIEQVETLSKDDACRVIMPGSVEDLHKAELAVSDGQRDDVVVATYRLGEDKDNCVATHGGIATTDLIRSFVGTLAERATATGQFSAMVMAGGDVAYAALSRLGVQAIRVVREIVPGIVFGIAVGGVSSGMNIVTKAGGFGDPESLCKVFDWLRNQKG